MLDEDARNGSEENSRKKRRYVTPELVRYGQVRDMTQGGSGGDPEYLNCNRWATKTRRCNPSDRRLKENIVRIGDHPFGIGLYLFDYKPEFRDELGHGRQFGVMAQEVETVMPEAVFTHPDGYKMVDYEILGISRAACPVYEHPRRPFGRIAFERRAG